MFTDAMMLPMLAWLAAHAAGTIIREQADSWITEQTERGKSDPLLLLAIPLFVASATAPKPGSTDEPLADGVLSVP